MKSLKTVLSYLLAGPALLSVLGSVDAEEDWLRFRGESGIGVSDVAAPTSWSPDKNVKWKVELPGAGVSSPIIVDDKIFLTCYSGYGTDDDGSIEDLKRHVVCIDRATGKLLWDKSIAAIQPEDVYQGMGVPQHGYASHTPVSDGESVFAFIGKSGVVAFDLDGKQLWQTSVGTESDSRRWGSASSPILYKNLVIVPAICESMSIYALDKDTGEIVWQEEAAGLESCWGTPVIVNVDDERSDLVIGVPGEIWGMNPETGKMRWICEAIPGNSFYTSVVAKDGIIYGSAGGRGGGGSVAVKAGGKGDVSASNVVWKGNDQSSYATPIVAKGKMYFVSRDIATIIDAETGESIERVRLKKDNSGSSDAEGEAESGQLSGRQRSRRGGSGVQDYSSPVLAGDKLYYIKGSGETFVFSTGEKFEQIAVNKVTHDSEVFSASPAVSEGQLFLRSNKHLYCIEAKN